MKKLIIALVLFIAPLNLTSREYLDEAYQYNKNNEFNKAIEAINSCLDDVIADGDPKEMDYAFFGLALNHIRLGNVDSALKYILVAYDIEKKHNLNQFKTLNELGLIYSEKGLNHQAIYYLKKALDVNNESGNLIDKKRNLSNLGFTYTKIKMIDSANYYLKSALNLTKNNNLNDPILLNHIAYSFFQNKNYSESIKNLEQSYNSLSSKNNQLETYIISTNLELVKSMNNEDFNYSVFNEYLEFTRNNDNSIYFADANYKMSIIESARNDIDKGITFLNIANAIYVELGNISKAKEITSTFLEANKTNKVSNLKYSENQLSELLNIEYSKQLENDIEAKISSETYIAKIEDELLYAEISFYLALSILLSVIFTVTFTVYRIKKNNHIKMLIEGYNNYFNMIEQLDSDRLKLNMSKMVNYMVLDKSFENKTFFTEIVDEVVKDTNKIRKTVRSGIDFKQKKRLNNA